MIRVHASPHRLLLLLSAFASLNTVVIVHAAGNEEDVIVEDNGDILFDTTERIAYQCTFRNLWTPERQPVHFPVELGRWAGPILFTHTLQFQPWRASSAVTRGVEKLAEDGFTDVLISEIEQQSAQTGNYSEYPNSQFFVNERDFVHLPPVEADQLYPYLTMMASMLPSPDWFTGFYSYWLIDEYTRTWYDHIKIQTKPWKAGTDGGETYEALESDLDPPDPTERIIPRTAPPGGELLDPTGTTVPNVGEIECFLVVGDNNDFILPDCDWFANPCCNETDTVSCGNSLPYGAVPSISAEYASVVGDGADATTTSSTLTTTEKLNRLEEIAGEMRQLADEVETLVKDLRQDEDSSSSSSATATSKKRLDDDL